MPTQPAARLEDPVNHPVCAALNFTDTSAGHITKIAKNQAVDAVAQKSIEAAGKAIIAAGVKTGLTKGLLIAAESASAIGNVALLAEIVCMGAQTSISGPCSPDVSINGKPAARVTDIAKCAFLGHVPNIPTISPIIEGSTTVFINGLPAARSGDPLSCGAAILSGSKNVGIG